MTASPLNPMTSRARERLRARPLWRRGTLAAAALLHVVLLAAPPLGGRALAEDRVKGEVKVTTDGGYVRLGFRFEKEVPATVELTYPIMVIAFEKPIAISVDWLSVSAGGAISAARLDPDGMSIRIALARKVKFNSTPAAERLYVDLLPESWSEGMPGLPRDVVEELAKRALDAERQLRLQRFSPKTQKPAAIRVKVATQPTFTRYVFAMPDFANVVPENAAGKLTLEFDQPIKWDLADAKMAMPATLRSVDTEVDEDSATVVFALNGSPKVRTFREDRSIVVDVDHAAAKPKAAAPGEKPKQDAGAPAAVPGIAPPETVPAKDAAPPPRPPKPPRHRSRRRPRANGRTPIRMRPSSSMSASPATACRPSSRSRSPRPPPCFSAPIRSG